MKSSFSLSLFSTAYRRHNTAPLASVACLLATAAPTVTGVALTLPLVTTSASAAAAGPNYEAAPASSLTRVALPKGALRLTPSAVPDSVTDVLKSLVKAGGDGVRQGKVEVLAWTGPNFTVSNLAGMRAKVGSGLKASGWTYEEESETKDQPFTLVTVMRREPTKRGIIGVWAHADDTLMLAWTELLPAADPEPADKSEPISSGERSLKGIFDGLRSKPMETSPVPKHVQVASASESAGAAPAASASATEFTVPPTQLSVNVMKSALPPLPSFPKLAPKRGVVRGYVKDAKGNPLKGAVIGVRSSSAGGFYSGASGKSDAKGYYEIAVPWGAAEFYTASITQDYGDGRAAFGLHPADGEADSFATANGLVENWVLVPYGIADRDKASDDPKYSGNYYGGTLTISYYVMDSRFPDDRSLPEGSEIEVNLIPAGPLIDGSTGKTFVLRRRVQESAPTTFYVNNVPVGNYKIFGDAGGKWNPELSFSITAAKPTVNNIIFEENDSKFEG
ncbi:MAG: hypothetical protein V4671_11255, partial [Armatimonadota bacterium]